MNKFDEAARSWDSRPDIVERNRIIGEELERRIHFHPDMRVLDYGAGTGLMSVFFADRAKSVTAADTSEGMIEVLSEKLSTLGMSTVSPVLIDGIKNDALKGQFDLIFTGMTLHHVEHLEIILKKFSSLTASGGWIAIADLVAEDGSFHGDRDDVHHHGFQESDLATTLSSLGYAHCESSHIHTMKREKDGVSHEFPVFLMTGKKP